jgi:hypothetical protein
MIKRIWPYIVNRIGGVHEFGRLWIVIYNDGLSVAWRQVEKIDWRIK